MRLPIRFLSIVSFCFVVGCSSDSGNTEQSKADTNGGTIATSSLARNTAPLVSDTELAAVVSGNTEFTLKLFPLLDSAPDINTFFSPYSITQAFALLAPGARGTTLSEIEQMIFFSPAQANRDPVFNKLDLLLAAKTTGTALANGQLTPKLNNANAVWGQKGFSILPAYLDTLAVNYGAGLHLVDFITATESSRQTINSWVEEQTNHRIQNLIPQGEVSGDTRLVLTNVIWFKADWASPFSKTITSNQTFTNHNNSASSVPFMRKQFSLPYAQTSGCQAVDIPYAGDNLSMLVIMPAPGTFDAFLASLTPAVLADITGHLSDKMAFFSMPKFSFTKTTPVGPILRSLGMVDTFSPGLADLSGIDGNHDLFVAAVFHQAFIGVDEAGTEAAAATAITIGTTMAPVSNLTLDIDHPFIFLIRDRQTGLILFMGKVVSLQ